MIRDTSIDQTRIVPKPTISNMSPSKLTQISKEGRTKHYKIIGKTCLCVHLSRVRITIGLNSVVVLHLSPYAIVFGVREPGDHLRVLLLLLLLLLLHLLLGDEVLHQVLGIHLVRGHAIGHNAARPYACTEIELVNELYNDD